MQKIDINDEQLEQSVEIFIVHMKIPQNLAA